MIQCVLWCVIMRLVHHNECQTYAHSDAEQESAMLRLTCYKYGSVAMSIASCAAHSWM